MIPDENELLVMFKDSGGLPRAWARGPKSDRAAVEEEARVHLARYVSEKRALGEPITANDFTMVVAGKVRP